MFILAILKAIEIARHVDRQRLVTDEAYRLSIVDRLGARVSRPV
jgi:hypothetical protein